MRLGSRVSERKLLLGILAQWFRKYIVNSAFMDLLIFRKEQLQSRFYRKIQQTLLTVSYSHAYRLVRRNSSKSLNINFRGLLLMPKATAARSQMSQFSTFSRNNISLHVRRAQSAARCSAGSIPARENRLTFPVDSEKRSGTTFPVFWLNRFSAARA